MVDMAAFPLADELICVEVSGEYDLADRPLGRKAIQAALDSEADSILLDLSRCRFIDSAGLRSIAESHEEAAKLGKGFVVLDTHLQVERFLAILELNDDIEIAVTREEALSQLTASSAGYVGVGSE